MASRVPLFFLIGLFVAVAFSQTTLTVDPEHSAIPTAVPNPYANPNSTNTWLEQHNQTWYNSSLPNSPWSNATDSNGNFDSRYFPGRAPAFPLAVRSPYTSAWASTANNGSLNSQYPIFWDGSDLGWEGIVTVDGISYEWMGVGSRSLPQLPNFISAVPISTAYDSSYSNFTFAAGPIELTASFFSPVLPRDLCRTSIPLSYLSVSVSSKDGSAHNVSLYTDINGAWVTQPAAPLTWKIYQPNTILNGNSVIVNATNATQTTTSLYSWIIELQSQYILGENYGQDPQRAGQGVFPQWGNFTWTSSQGPAQSMNFESGFSVNQRFRYVSGIPLNNIVDSAYRSYTEQEPVFAFEHALGYVTPAGTNPIQFTIGHIVHPAVRHLSSTGIELLPPWWVTCYGSNIFNLIAFHYNDLPEAQRLANQFETKLKNDINVYYRNADNNTNQTPYSSDPPPYWYNGTSGQNVSGIDQYGNQYIFSSDTAYGYLTPPDDICPSHGAHGIAIPDTSEEQSYYAITALAARQVLGAITLTVPSAASTTQSEPFAFLKEMSSSGNVNTVDVIFPAIPFFLWINPSLLRYLLDPLYLNQESHFYPNNYSMHDLGSHFPNATGHVEGNDEYMPVEESGNMIIMALAIYKFDTENGLAFIQRHYPILQQWATYLVQYSLIPASQLSTDDFAGQLANQTNLAIKGIVSLSAMAELSTVVGDDCSALNYSMIAQDYYNQWSQLAIDSTGTHTVLAYQWRSSWGLLYNTYPAKLLGLDIIPQSLYTMQSNYYPSVSQIWGVPLDSRKYWTKSDWEMWTAATCEPSTRRLFVNSIAYWLNTTSAGNPFPDLYQTVHHGEPPQAPELVEFFARPVQGGLYSLLALVADESYL